LFEPVAEAAGFYCAESEKPPALSANLRLLAASLLLRVNLLKVLSTTLRRKA